MAALVLFDTNILIDCSKGYAEALAELAYWDGPSISAVTWMEWYGGAEVDEVPRFDAFMAEFGLEIIDIDAEIMRVAAMLVSKRRRAGKKLALPDAIIQATADVHKLMIITRNIKDFRGANVRVPYTLETITITRVVDVNPPGETPNPLGSTRPKLKRRR
jgi:predicted nucleic acid-binding protein